MTTVDSKLEQFALACKREDSHVLAYLSTGFSNGFSDVWHESSETLSRVLELPNLSTRAGLKKIHADFKAIQARLNATYKHFRRRNHYNGMGGLVTIYVTICVGDTILQDRLFDHGLFDKLLALLDEPTTRNMSLMALNSLVRAAGKRLFSSLSGSLPVLLHTRSRYPEDEITQSLIISIITRCSMAQTTRSLDTLPQVLSSTLDAMRDPNMTAWSFRHGLLFLRDAIDKAPELCASNPSFITFYVALMRSSDLRRRMQALDGLWRLAFNLPQSIAAEQPVNAFSLVAFVEMNPLPPDLAKICDTFGRDKCVLSMLKRARDNVAALLVMSAMPDPDYVAIGRGLATEMVACPYMAGDRVCYCCGERSAQTDGGPMPELLEKCASALRATGTKKNVRRAVILELRAHAINHRQLSTSEAEKYDLMSVYASDVVHSCQRIDLFPLIKKALRQPAGRPAWMQRMMRSDAASHGLLRAARTTGVCDEERVALLHSAREDSIKLMEVDVASPDSLSSQGDSATYILSAMMLDSLLTTESPDIKDALERIAVNKRFLDYLGNPVRPQSTAIRVSEFVTQNLSSALMEWGGMLSRVSELAEKDERAQQFIEAESRGSEQLHLWLDRFEQKEDARSQAVNCADDVLHTCEPGVEFTCRKILFCSWCRRPSAVLKKRHMALVESKLKQIALARQKEDSDSLAFLSTGFSNGFSDAWCESAEMLSRVLELPNLDTRAGLKKVHTDFKAIQARLHATYKYFRRKDHYDGMGGLMTIYVAICVGDTILQDTLLDYGLFDKFMDLLDEPLTRNMPLLALNSLIRIPGKRLTSLLAGSLPILVYIRNQHPEDQVTQSLVMSLVARCTMMQSASVMKTLNKLPLLITDTLNSMRDPNMSAWTFRHGLLFLRDAIIKAPDLCAGQHSLITFYVALMRSSDLRRRMQALDGLRRLVIEQSPGKDDAEPVNAFGLVALVEKNPLPQDLAEICDAFGREKCTLSLLKHARDNVSALLAMSAMPDPDYVAIGRGLAVETENCPYLVGDLVCDCCGERSPRSDDGQMSGLLKICAGALRATGNTKDVQWAETLELRALSLSGKTLSVSEAKKHSLTSIYASHVLCSGRRMDLFPLAKKALRKPEGRPAWIQHLMRHDTAYHALQRSAREAGVRDEERVALLHSAHEDALRLIEVDMAPPDALSGQGDSALYIVTAMMLDPSLTLESPDIKNALERIDVNQRFLSHLQNPVHPRAAGVQVCKYVTDNISEALSEWGGMLRRAAELFEKDERAQLLMQAETRGPEALQLWLDRFEQKDETQPKDLECGADVLHVCEPLVEPTCPKILFCSWCRRPSAVVKKCARCRQTTYCDSECQKLHWKQGHKEVCTKAGEGIQQGQAC
ncbi:unnamed protein product [Peniophora sp. CBMAI 1063]|nr:unnamed protein product [Peniophora sp. CBMAI 1063]